VSTVTAVVGVRRASGGTTVAGLTDDAMASVRGTTTMGNDGDGKDTVKGPSAGFRETSSPSAKELDLMVWRGGDDW